MFQGKIYNKLIKAIKDKIEDAQKRYDEGVKALEQKLEEDKEKLEETIVNNFLKNIL